MISKLLFYDDDPASQSEITCSNNNTHKNKSFKIDLFNYFFRYKKDFVIIFFDIARPPTYCIMCTDKNG